MTIELTSSAVRPGETIRGFAGWTEIEQPQAVVLRLLWFTEGKGGEDTETVATVDFAAPLASDRREFSFVAPVAPSSFAGRLISIIWAVELETRPGATHRKWLTIAPDGEELTSDHPEWLAFDEPASAWRT